MDFLKKQINKSYQEKKLITTGFSLQQVDKNEKQKSLQQNIVVKKSGSGKTGDEDESQSKQTPTTSQPAVVNIALVSNDYDSDTSNSN